MKFVKYPKIHRFGKDETIGILDGYIVVQEKIDGANASIWWDEDAGMVKCGSRTRELPLDESFNGFQEYVRNNKKIEKFLKENQQITLYGEWLVRHTISYDEKSYKKFYLFDIYDNNLELFGSRDMVRGYAAFFGVETPQTFCEGNNMTLKQIMKYVGKTNLGLKGEGVVIKNLDFVNKFGNLSYAKIVSEQFMENNALVFGGNNKFSPTYGEMYIVNKYATLARVRKVVQKLQSQTNETLDKRHTKQVAGACLYDMITEEIWEATKKIHVINFTVLYKLATKKFIQMYHDMLDGDISVADKEKNEAVDA